MSEREKKKKTNYEFLKGLAKIYEDEMLKICSKYSYFWLLLQHKYLKHEDIFARYMHNPKTEKICEYQSIIDSLKTPILDISKYKVLLSIRPKREVFYNLSRMLYFLPEEQNYVNELNKFYVNSIIHPMVENNLGLAYSRAFKLGRGNNELSDIIQAGLYGLTVAAHKYDFNKETRFSTYATYWIDQKIRFCINNDMYKIYVPSNIKDKIANMHKTGKVNKDLQEIYEMAINTVSLDVSALMEDSDSSLYDIISYEQKSFDEINKICALDKFKDKCKSLLNEKEFYILIRRYGLFGYTRKTLKSIGKELGTSGKQIRNIENAILDKLRRDKEIIQILSSLRECD